MNVIRDNKIILNLHINKTDGLWGIPISRPLRNRAHVMIKIYKTKTELIQYL